MDDLHTSCLTIGQRSQSHDGCTANGGASSHARGRRGGQRAFGAADVASRGRMLHALALASMPRWLSADAPLV